MILIGDIGGTKTNLALFQEKNTTFSDFQTFNSQGYSDFNALVSEYLYQVKATIRGACFAVAGPVINGMCRTTNLPWIVETTALQKATGISNLYLINDLEANAWALDVMPSTSFHTLRSFESVKGNRAVISPGTGLGEAGIYFDGVTYHPFASEGGHSDFAPTDQLESELWHYLYTKWQHVSCERVLSGPGFLNIYEFLRTVKKREVPLWLEKEMQQGDSAAAVITQNANKAAICLETTTIFIKLLAHESANLALKMLSTGGLYIGGGIAPKILDHLKEPLFLEEFLKKGRMCLLLERIPIHVILDDKANLYGAAHKLRRITSLDAAY